MRTIRFNDLTFDEDMLSARRTDGTELRLTRQERALLLHFTQQPGKLLTRRRLVELMTRDASDTSERNIDFLVNRLRKVLGDNARKPRFIATQYGEGYVWIARTMEPTCGRRAFLRLGPAYGMRRSTQRTHSTLAQLTQALKNLMGSDRAVDCVPDWQPEKSTDDVTYSLDVSFHAEEETVHAAFVLRHAATRAVLSTFRARFASARCREIEQVARDIQADIWKNLAAPAGPAIAALEKPLEVRLYEAAELLARTPVIWRENEVQLARARTEKPDDPQLAIMWALNLYMRLLSQALEETEMMPADDWAAIEDEIEHLALSSLPKVQDNPLLVLGVAKLLFFIDRGHAELAAQLADEAFAKSTAFAAAFAMQGQIRMARGNIDEAIAYLDEAIEMSEIGSAFHRYLLVLKITALLAEDRRAAMEEVCAALFAVKPQARLELAFLLARADTPRLPDDIEAMFAHLEEDRARKLLAYIYNIFARRFQRRRHRRNVMRGLITHMKRHFGDAIVPDAIAQAVGGA